MVEYDMFARWQGDFDGTLFLIFAHLWKLLLTNLKYLLTWAKLSKIEQTK